MEDVNLNHYSSDDDENMDIRRQPRRKVRAIESSDSDDDSSPRSQISSPKQSSFHRPSQLSSDDSSSSENRLESDAKADPLNAKRRSYKSKLEKPFTGAELSDSDEEVKRGRLLKDNELFDAEDSEPDPVTNNLSGAESSEGDRSRDERDSESDGSQRKLNSNYRGPASKSARKKTSLPTRKSKSAADESIKMYSEKQRILRERDIVVPVYKPPKRSLVEFLRERDPKLADRLINNRSSNQPLDGTPHKQKMGVVEKMKNREKEILENLANTHSQSYHYFETQPITDGITTKLSTTASIQEEDEQLQSFEINGPITGIETNSQVSDSRSVAQSQVTTQPMETQEAPSQPMEITNTGRSDESLKLPSQPMDSLELFSQPIETLDDASQPIEPSHLNSQSEPNKTSEEDTQLELNSNQIEMKVEKDSQDMMSSSIKQEIVDGDISCPSTIQVHRITAAEVARRDAKKARLRALLGDSVDLDAAPRCGVIPDENGMVQLDPSAHFQINSKLEQFKEKVIQNLSTKSRKDKETEDTDKNHTLSVLKTLPDGSQRELSMSQIVHKNGEQLGGVNKLTVLKEILTLKIQQKRVEQFNQRQETVELGLLEEEPEEEEMTDDEDIDDEADDEAEDERDENDGEGKSDDDGDLEKVNLNDEESVGKPPDADVLKGDYDFNKDEKFMTRVRAVLDSDVEEDDEMITSQKHIESEIDQSQATSSNIGQSEAVNSKTDQSHMLMAKSAPGLMDLMMSTQQAEDEISGLLSGSFATQAPVTQSRSVTQVPVAQPDQAVEDLEVTTENPEIPAADKPTGFTTDGKKVEQPAKVSNEASTHVEGKRRKAAALNFSDEEDEVELPAKRLHSENEAEDPLETENPPEAEDPPEAGDSSEDGEMEEDLEMEEDGEMEEDDIANGVEDDVMSDQENIDPKIPMLSNQFLRPQKKKRRLNLDDYMDEEAELSGSDVGADEKEDDLSDDEEFRRLCDGDNDDVGTESQQQDQLGKIHMKRQRDDDDRMLRLMKERFLADGDLHSNSKRQRAFKWSNVMYRDEVGGMAFESSQDAMEEMTPEQIEQEKKRKEFFTFVRQQRVEERQKWDTNEESNTDEALDRSAPVHTVPQVLPTLPPLKKPLKKKAGMLALLGDARMSELKDAYKNFKAPEGRTVNSSSKAFLFRPVSKSEAGENNDQIWDKA